MGADKVDGPLGEKAGVVFVDELRVQCVSVAISWRRWYGLTDLAMVLKKDGGT